MTSSIESVELASLYGASSQKALPAYQRLKNLVTEQILSGRWSEGDLLPSENQLVHTLGLSRMTINRAFRELTVEGLVVRSIGVGTFVAERKSSSALFEIRNIADEIARRGRQHRTEVVFSRRELADSRVQRQLDIPLGDVVFHSLVVHFQDELAIQLEDRLVNPSMAPHYIDQDFTMQTPNSYLTRVAPLASGEHVVEAIQGSDEDCRLLGVDPGEPCLLLQRRTWSSGKLVSAARLLHPGSRYRLQGTFEAG